ncbi:hypothetical protein DRJ25_02000 [Candidatus Woesearchaeota archaeon]|nr:MAG: hypothetical protein DRJ25_02000 [Candidatus Woesearchaeota archaeon]
MAKQTLADCIIDNIVGLSKEGKHACKLVVKKANRSIIPLIEMPIYSKDSKLILSLNANQNFESDYLPIFIGQFIISELTDNVFKQYEQIKGLCSEEFPFKVYINAYKTEKKNGDDVFYSLDIADSGKGISRDKLMDILSKLAAAYKLNSEEKLSLDETKILRNILSPEKKGEMGIVGLYQITEKLHGSFKITTNFDYDENGKMICDKLKFPVIGESMKLDEMDKRVQRIMNNSAKTYFHIEIPEISLKKMDDIISKTQQIQKRKYE